MKKEYSSGFTLLELAVVGVIVGLIIAGVFMGEALLSAAKLKKIHREQEEFTSAVTTFKGKYNCMPGDCDKATQYFGTHADCPDLSTADASSPGFFPNTTPVRETCNGDNDGRIDSDITLYEETTFWQHLANAGLISGIYAGGLDLGGAGFMPGVNVPIISALGPSYFWITVDGDEWSLLNLLTISPPNMALAPGKYGTILSMAIGIDNAFVLTPTQAKSLDDKYDDGMPATGKILVFRDLAGSTPHCTDASDETANDPANITAQYSAADPAYRDKPLCSLGYVTGW